MGIETTRSPICYRNRHLRSSDIDMDDIRSSFSKLKKDIKHRLRGKKHAPGKAGADTTGERADSPGPLPQLEPDSVASGHEGGSRTGTDVRKAHSRDPSPQPKLIPTGGGNKDPQKGDADVDEKEVSQGHPGLDPGTKVAAGSGPNQGVRPSPSPPSLPHEAELGSTCSPFASSTLSNRSFSFRQRGHR